MEGGTILADRYEVLRLLGRGGMGSVYLARDVLLGREVALKILKGSCAGEHSFRERFRSETKSAAALSHPNIVAVFDAGETAEGLCYMAMEPVGGGTLEERIEKEGPLPPEEAVRVASEVAQALSYAHDHGIVHRDIKPQNVLLTEDGAAKVADFGIAKAADATTVTATDLILGTVRYLSPEQATGGDVGPASDLYSLGVTLYEMLVGKVPFDAENPIAIAMKHVREAPPPLRKIEPEVPRELEAVSLKLLSKDPVRRYVSAADLAEDLGRYLRGEQPAAPGLVTASTREATSDDQRARTVWLARAEKANARRTRRRQRRLGGVAVVLVAMLGLTLLPAFSGKGVPAGAVETLEKLRVTVESAVGSTPDSIAVATVTAPPVSSAPEAPGIPEPPDLSHGIRAEVSEKDAPQNSEARQQTETASHQASAPRASAPEALEQTPATTTATIVPAEEPVATGTVVETAEDAAAPAVTTVPTPEPSSTGTAHKPAPQVREAPANGDEESADGGNPAASLQKVPEPQTPEMPDPATTTVHPSLKPVTADPEEPEDLTEATVQEPVQEDGESKTDSPVSSRTAPASAVEIQDATQAAIKKQLSGMPDR